MKTRFYVTFEILLNAICFPFEYNNLNTDQKLEKNPNMILPEYKTLILHHRRHLILNIALKMSDF